MISASVIIPFYNNVSFLKLVLAGYRRQSLTDFEVIIADDGSNEESVAAVKDLMDAYPFKIKHQWHDDDGFRKTIMLNRCIMAASADILIFNDGDCIPHQHFVKEHISSTKPGTCSTGRRVNLSKTLSNQLTTERIEQGILDRSHLHFIWAELTRSGDNARQAFYLKTPTLRRWRNKTPKGLLGSNMSIHKQDLLNINGFDERYRQPGIGEDTDIDFRLQLNGVTVKTLIHMAIQYHLHHKMLPRPQQNDALFATIQQQGTARTAYGIQKSASN